MKKIAIFACVLVIGASAAFAATIVVPLFVEVPGSVQAFIGISNLETTAGVWTITYTQQDASGNFVTGTPATWNQDALQGLAFTPISVNNPAEGPGSKVPDMSPNTGPSGNPNVAGAATITTPGGATGRYQQINGVGSAQFSFGTAL